jgi:hypothetical protein
MIQPINPEKGDDNRGGAEYTLDPIKRRLE